MLLSDAAAVYKFSDQAHLNYVFKKMTQQTYNSLLEYYLTTNLAQFLQEHRAGVGRSGSLL